MSLLLLGVVVSQIVLGMSCVSDPPVDLHDYERFRSPEESRERFETSRATRGRDGGGSSVGLLVGDQLRTERDTGLIYASSGERFQAEMSYLNHDDHESKEFALIALLNFQQIHLRLDGHWDHAHHILVKPNEEQLFTIETEPLADGGHSLILAIIHPSYPAPGMPPDSRVISPFPAAVKLFIVVGGNPSSPDTEAVLESIDETPPSWGSGLMINKDRLPKAGFFSEWAIEEVAPGAEIAFFAHMSNDGPEDIAVVMLPLIDYRQPEDIAVLHAEVPADTQHSYALTLRAPEEEGDYEMFFIWSANLYEYLRLSVAGRHPDIRPADLTISDLVIIRVRNVK